MRISPACNIERNKSLERLFQKCRNIALLDPGALEECEASLEKLISDNSEHLLATKRRGRKIQPSWTDREIEDLVYEPALAGKNVYTEPTTRGLELVIYYTGTKVFRFRYRFKGKRYFDELGRPPTVSIGIARSRAIRLYKGLQEGLFPREVLRSERNRTRSFSELSERYLVQYARRFKRTWKKDEQRIKHHLLPVWGERPACLITPDDVDLLHAKISEKAPFAANRVMEIARKIFNLGIRWRFLEGPNPVVGMRWNHEQERERWITTEELSRLTRSLEEEIDHPFAVAAVWLLILTGARKNEVLNARWSDVDFERQELILPKTKNGKSHRIHLSDPAISLLQQVPRDPTNRYIFQGLVKGRPLQDIHRFWDRVRKRAGLADVRIHDIRRTVGSWMAQNGESLHLIGEVLNHRSPASTRVYARLSREDVIRALDDHSRHVMDCIGVGCR